MSPLYEIIYYIILIFFRIHNHQILPLFGFYLPFHLLVLTLHLSGVIFPLLVSYSLLQSFLIFLIKVNIVLFFFFSRCFNTNISYHNKLMLLLTYAAPYTFSRIQFSHKLASKNLGLAYSYISVSNYKLFLSYHNLVFPSIL